MHILWWQHVRVPRLFTPLLAKMLVAKLRGLGGAVGVLVLVLGGLVIASALFF